MRIDLCYAIMGIWHFRLSNGNRFKTVHYGSLRKAGVPMPELLKLPTTG